MVFGSACAHLHGMPATFHHHQQVRGNFRLPRLQQTDGKKSHSVYLCWELKLRPHGAQPNFVELLDHALGLGHTLGCVNLFLSFQIITDKQERKHRNKYKDDIKTQEVISIWLYWDLFL